LGSHSQASWKVELILIVPLPAIIHGGKDAENAPFAWTSTGSGCDGSNSELAWSLGEVFMHIAIDENYLRDNIARPLLEGVQLGQTHLIMFDPIFRVIHNASYFRPALGYWARRL